MDLYRYKAIDSRGRTLTGRVNAVNPVDLEVRLKRMGMDLIRYKQATRGRAFFGAQNVNRRDQIAFFYHLVQLLEAGVPIRDALCDLRDSVDGVTLREVTAAVIESIDGGKSLSEAMRDFSYVFSSITVSLIKAGEESGQLTRVLNNIIENLKWQDEQRAHFQQLLLYPAFVAVVVFSVIIFLMLYVVPELLRFVQQMGQSLPFHTRALIWASGFFSTYWYVLLLAPLVMAAAGALVWRRSPAFRVVADHYLLQIPVLGPMIKKIIMARFANYFAIMYASGITVLDCIRAGEEIVGNRAIEIGIRTAGRQIGDGVGLSASFQATDLFPPLVLRMLRIGETTGSLEQALQNIGYFYTRDVRESVERLQSVIEPAMTVVIGLIMGWVILSVLGPIYDLVTKIKV